MLRGLAWFLVLLCPAAIWAQSESFPIILGRSINLLAPAVGGARATVVFGAAITPEGTTLPTVDLYAAAADGSNLRRLTRLVGQGGSPQGATAVSLSADGSRAAFTALPSGSGSRSEEIHVVDMASATDRTVAVDTQGCIQPLCAGCFFTCVNTPHLSPDGATVLYSVRRQQPFYTVRADGSGLTRLPVYSGTLAPGPQRVISRSGLVVFSSSAPFGPTFAATALDVYVMNLDGAGIRAVTKFGNDPAIFASNATISADGTVVTFESNRDPDAGAAGKTTEIWLVRADGSGLRRLTSGSEASTSPSLSADGSLVAFVRAGQIYVVRSDGTGLKAVTQFKLSSAQEPVLSDDGSLVVFSLGPQNGERGAIYAVASDGSNLRAVYAPRSLNQSGITGWDAFAPVSPGALFSAYGANLTGDALAAATGFPLPQSLAGVSLLVNGVPAPLIAASPWQVNAQLPPETPQGPASFQFRFADGGLPAAGAAEVKLFSPVIFSLMSENTCQAAVLHGGTGTLVDGQHPAQAGETLEMYGTGLGPTDPVVPSGRPAPSAPLARTSTPDVLIGGKPAAVTFAGLTPGLAGVYQVNATVPFGLRPGRQAVSWRIGGATSNGCGTIAVR